MRSIGDRVQKYNHGDTGTIQEIREHTLARVKWDNTGESWESTTTLYRPGDVPHYLPIHSWDQWPDVVNYAMFRGLDLDEAIRRLITTGLLVAANDAL